MLTVHATLLPNGQVQLPPGLAGARPVPVLVTILEPISEPKQTQAELIASVGQVVGAIDAAPPADALAGLLPPASGKGSVAQVLALLASPEFQALPKADPQEVEERIQALRNDWNDH